MSTYTERNDDGANEWKQAQRRATQDVYSHFAEELDRGPLNPERRERAAESLIPFCDTYGDGSFYLPWSPNHLEAAHCLEDAVREGACIAYAMPRGSGKTTIAWWAVIWAILNGYSSYGVLIGKTATSAKRLLKNIKSVLRHNDKLFEDYPEACCPIRHIRGDARRAGGQLFKGQSTEVEWGQEQIVLPTIDLPYSQCSASIIDVCGIEGEIRGRQFNRPDGRIARPTFAICDDPQDRDSARSPKMCEERLDTIRADVRYMAGPDNAVGVAVPCTIIYEDDVAHELTDRKKSPEWNGLLMRMIESFPANERLWEEYARILEESLQNGNKGREATQFYIENREAMDAGCVVTWPDRYHRNKGEVSAIQHAMTLYLMDEPSFQAEYQNAPVKKQDDQAELPSAEFISKKLNGVKQGIVPDEFDKLTGFIDCSGKVLWWGLMGVGDGFTCGLVDYGVFPEQVTRYTTLAGAKRTLMDRYGHAGEGGQEAALYDGLVELLNDIMGRDWLGESGQAYQVDRLLVDEGWMTSVVHAAIRSTPYGSRVMSSRGRGIGASSAKPLNDPDTRPKAGERRGDHWKISRSKDGTRHVQFDTNYWKSFFFSRVTTPAGAPGSCSLPGKKPSAHKMLCDQLTAETAIDMTNERTGRTVREFQPPTPDHPDNHFLDCVVGALVAASIEGAKLNKGAAPGKKRKAKTKKRKTLAERRAEKRVGA